MTNRSRAIPLDDDRAARIAAHAERVQAVLHEQRVRRTIRLKVLYPIVSDRGEWWISSGAAARDIGCNDKTVRRSCYTGYRVKGRRVWRDSPFPPPPPRKDMRGVNRSRRVIRAVDGVIYDSITTALRAMGFDTRDRKWCVLQRRVGRREWCGSMYYWATPENLAAIERGDLPRTMPRRWSSHPMSLKPPVVVDDQGHLFCQIKQAAAEAGVTRKQMGYAMATGKPVNGRLYWRLVPHTTEVK